MNPWLPLGAALAYNYHRHKRGRSTICSTTRRFIPDAPTATTLLVGGFALLLEHYLGGYPIAIDLEHLTD